MSMNRLLHSIPVFAELSKEDLEALSHSLRRISFRAGETIFNLGDPGNAMYIVEHGSVNIHLPGGDSRRIVLEEVSRGEYFGELSLFDKLPRSANAVATTSTVVLELEREILETYLAERPRAAMAILHTMTSRLRETNTLLSARAAKNVDAEFDHNLTWSDRLADAVAQLNGSWTFILVLLALTIGWCVLNTTVIMRSPLDPYPYQFFNLALGILVGLQGPLIVMSQNRQSIKDRARSETDFKVNLKNELNIETLLLELRALRSETAARGNDSQDVASLNN
jgi:uncharacterized membrane protein